MKSCIPKGIVKRSVDYINSNLANFGTELEYQVKLASAQSEEAWQQYSRHNDALKVWRVERFKIKDWPTELYGKFHVGDCYIVINRKGVAPAYTYDLHFWLGDESSIDERGTAAYKTAELDTFLGGVPVQHLETQHNESSLFRNYFTHLEYLPGGIETGFRHVEKAEYKEWLVQKYRFGDVTVRDCGEIVYVHEDTDCAISDRLSASTLVFSLRCSRPDVTVKHLC